MRWYLVVVISIRKFFSPRPNKLALGYNYMAHRTNISSNVQEDRGFV